MRHRKGWIVLILIIIAFQLSACGRRQGSLNNAEPAHVEHIQGTELSRVTLTEMAMKRLDLRTEQVREQRVSRSDSPKITVPYSSLIYDPKGQTWVYTSPEPRAFIRHRVEVDYIEGDIAVLNDGPPAGTIVATVGVAELYGTEFGVGH